MLEVIDALVAVCMDALDGLDATVVEGVPADPIETPYGLSVGLGYNDDSPITITDDPIGTGPRSDAALIVRCIGQVLASVDADLADVRRDAAAMMARIDTRIATDQTLGGAVAMAWIGGIQRFWPARTNEAAVWTLAFDVYLTVLE